MNEQDLRTLVARGESAQVEFKSTTGSLQAGVKTVCAFLNGKLPGYVFFGVRDDGRLVGQDVSAGTLEAVAQELRRIDPPAFPDIDSVVLENGHAVVVVRVPGGTGLYRYDGRPYQRVGATTGIMSTPVYEQRMMERLTTRSHRTRADGSGQSAYVAPV